MSEKGAKAKECSTPNQDNFAIVHFEGGLRGSLTLRPARPWLPPRGRLGPLRSRKVRLVVLRPVAHSLAFAAGSISLRLWSLQPLFVLLSDAVGALPWKV